ncbi:hypothetical protein N0V93_003327 [Gnomoniopsis smithogilvyi]|uniref:DNA ligase D 3'-phosphoesterase domain-containing protein n=1 Tax=Gnomoniopsis smithogilvyi TaxID=1191159 RepID=A0A9W8YWF7_9PEZI|nr:hypothetical protein N0V93_003327 [Gnomoniopsis smithogilvyi]
MFHYTYNVLTLISQREKLDGTRGLTAVRSMDSQRKRNTSPGFVTNPFIKKRNLEWRISPPPPPLRDPVRRRTQEGRRVESISKDGDRSISPPSKDHPSTSALIESAQLQIDNHLAYFTTLLTSRALTPFPLATPRLPIAGYTDLYKRADGSPTGAHFVVTQHDHPVAGPHYDLRLQINETSSCSWAIMYGLPGDPNSRGKTGRTGSGVLRNATETRVHCLWNHLVETAGRETGSLIVWDTGEYEVLLPPRRGAAARRGRPPPPSLLPSDSEESEADEESEVSGGRWAELTQQQKLARAFASRKIRLKLNGTRLPRAYVLNIRLTHDEDVAGRAKAARSGKKPRRRRRAQAKPAPKSTGPDTSDSDSSSIEEGPEEEYNDGATGQSAAGLSEMDKELRELEDEEVRRTNAYVGAVNTIGSVHQRKWYLSLEREACGFVKGRRDGKVWWERKDEGQEAADGDGNRLKWPFYVRGPEYERSVVTGRLGKDVLKDEGVVGYVGRKGWRPILG